jgi:O-antigen ligase
MHLLKKNQIIHLILASIIPFSIWGPFFPDLIVSLSSIVFLFYVIKNNNFYYLNNKPFIIFIIFCLYCIFITLLRAEDKLLSFQSSLFYFRIGLFSCLIWYLIDQDKNILKYFYYSLIICFSILVIDGYFQFFSGSNILGFPFKGGRISSLFGDELIMGSYLSRLFPLLFALFLIKEKSKYEIYYIGILFILVDILIYISGERTSFFFLNLSTIFIIILIKEFQKFRLITFLIALLLIVGLTLSSDELSNRMIKGPAKSMGLVKDAQSKNMFTPAHDSLIKTAFNMFKKKPIFGHGPKMFRKICSNEKYATEISPCMTHPHNFYVQLLAETGLIGFLFLFSGFCYVLYCGFMQLKSILFKQERYLTDYQVCLLSGILITVWPLSPNGNFFHNWLMIIYSLPVGFYLQSIYSRKKI